MKDSTTIAIAIALILAVAARLYRKYYPGGNKLKNSGGNKPSSFPSSSKEDDYEPYSKK